MCLDSSNKIIVLQVVFIFLNLFIFFLTSRKIVSHQYQISIITINFELIISFFTEVSRSMTTNIIVLM